MPEKLLREIKDLKTKLYGKDFLLTWEKDRQELEQVLLMADALRILRGKNISTRCFDSGLAVSLFRDNSTRTRFSFASAANLLGLEIQDLDEQKSQIAHGETVRETANMISFLTEVIGIRDDIFLGEGNKFMREVGEALDEGFGREVLPQRPGIVNLQCDIDHPTQSMADLFHLKNHFGSLDSLKGKKIAMTWAYSPSYGKPLSVPQGIIGLMSRFGMEVSLAFPKGYDLIPEVVKTASENAEKSGGSFTISDSMDEAFRDADIVYPKSWAPWTTMERRTELLKKSDSKGLELLEKESLENNRKYMDWECNSERIKSTKDGEALYMHCLPADITGVSCKNGEVDAEVFEKYRKDTYIEAGYKPYIIAAMIMANKFKDPSEVLNGFIRRGADRRIEG